MAWDAIMSEAYDWLIESWKWLGNYLFAVRQANHNSCVWPISCRLCPALPINHMAVLYDWLIVEAMFH